MFYQTEDNGRQSREKYPPDWADEEYDPEEDEEEHPHSFLP